MRYWLFLNHQLQGPYEKANLLELPEFRLDLPVCPEGSDEWLTAKGFPELTNPDVARKVVQSGDYHPENPLAGRRVDNWRQAIIPSSFEEKGTLLPPPAPSARPALAAHSPAGSLGNEQFSNGGLLKTGHRTWVMATLWIAFFGLYIPQMEQVDGIVDGLIANSYAVSAPPRLKGRRPGARGGWLRRRTMKNTIPAVSSPTIRNHTAGLFKDITRSESVVEEDSTDLGNGIELKTVLTVDQRKGTKTWKTHRYLRSRPAARYEPL